MTVKIGTATYENEKKKLKEYLPSFKDGSNLVRILPPVGECAEKGVWYTKRKVHFGFKRLPEKDQKEGKMFVFECPEEGTYNTRTKKFVVTKPCAECDRIRDNRNALKQAESALIAKGVDEKIARKKVREAKENIALVEFERGHSLSEKFYVNALTPEGKIGQLAIPRGVGKEAVDLIKAYFGTKRRDPLEPAGGFWLNFQKSGQGQFNTEYKVFIHKVETIVDGETLEKESKAPLSEEILNRMEDECFDLNNLYRKPTNKQVQEMVASNYDPAVTTAIFNDIVDAEAKAGEAPVIDETVSDDPFAQ